MKANEELIKNKTLIAIHFETNLHYTAVVRLCAKKLYSIVRALQLGITFASKES